MAKYHGKDGSAKADGTAIGEVTDWNTETTITTATASSMDSTGEEHLGGLSDGKGSVTCRHDPADAGQLSIAAGDIIALLEYPAGETAGLEQLSAPTALVTSVKRSADYQSTGSFAFDWIGAVTVGTVSA